MRIALSSTKYGLPITLCLLAVTIANAKPETLWHKMFRFLGISATSSKQKGGDGSGDVCITGISQTPSQLTWSGKFRSPIFSSDDKSILALDENNIIHISLGDGQATTMFMVKDIVKLLGYSPDNKSEVFVLLTNGRSRTPAIVNIKTHNIEKLPYDPNDLSDKQCLDSAVGSERSFGNMRIFVAATKSTEEIGKSWTDIYLIIGKKGPINASKSIGLSCSQPSFSHSGKYITYISETVK